MFKINPIFKKTKYITINTSKDNNTNKENIPNIPEGMWVKCDR